MSVVTTDWCMHAGSFTYIFKPALALGMLSRRQVFEAAAAFERERFGGLELPQALWSPATQAAAKGVECGDYHVSLGHLLKERPTQVRPPFSTESTVSFPAQNTYHKSNSTSSRGNISQDSKLMCMVIDIYWSVGFSTKYA